MQRSITNFCSELMLLLCIYAHSVKSTAVCVQSQYTKHAGKPAANFRYMHMLAMRYTHRHY
jgi:hypothetical protein